MSDPAWINQMIEDGAVVLDTRSPEEFAAGHLPGARSIPVADLIDDPETALFDMPFGKATTLILVASGLPGADHHRAAASMRDAGYDRVNLSTVEGE